MILLGADLIAAYKKRRPEAGASLDRWRKVMEETIFRSGHQVKRTFSKAYDYVPPRCHVFDIAQGRHRLVATIDFGSEVVNIESIMDHKHYDRWRCS